MQSTLTLVALQVLVYYTYQQTINCDLDHVTWHSLFFI
jgi:hypothetical protein